MKKLKIILSVLFLFALSSQCFATRYIYQEVVQDGKGNVVANAEVTVYLSGGTTKATIYTAVTGGAADADSVIETGSDGTYTFYVDEDDYPHNQQFKTVMSKSGYTADTWDYLQIFPDNNRTLITDSTADQGDSAVVGTLAWHITNASGNATTVTILAGTYTISQNVTVPATMTLKFKQGGILADDGSNADLTINGHIEAGPYQIFDWGTGTGTVELGSGSVINTLASWWGFASGASAAVNKAAIVAAMGSSPVGYGVDIVLPGGAFSVAADIQIDRKNVTIRGAASGYAYEGGQGGTALTFGAGTYGFDMGVTENAGNYGTIKNMKLIGSASISYGIGIYQQQIVEDVETTGFNLAGIIVANAGNQFFINRVSSSYNIGSGLIISEGVTSTTIGTISKSNFRRNGSDGSSAAIQILSGRHLAFKNVVVESNYAEGMLIHRTTGNAVPSDLRFENVWFEANNDTDGTHQVVISSDTAASYTDVPAEITFKNCSLYAETGKQNVNIIGGRHIAFDGGTLASVDGNSVDLGTYASFVRFKNYTDNFEQPSGYGNRSYWEEADASGSGGHRNYMGEMGAFLSAKPSDWFVSGSDAGVGELRLAYSYGAANIEADTSTTITVSPAIPTGSKIVGTQLRVDVALAAGETWDAEYIVSGAGQPDAVSIASNQAVAKNTKVDQLFDVNANTNITTATPTDVEIQKNGGGNFTAQGTIAAWIYYYKFITVADKP